MTTNTHWEVNANAMFTQLKALSNHLEMPKFFLGDLDIDHNILRKYDGRQFIWLVREAGTCLIPLRSGYPETTVAFYLSYGPAYLVDPDKGLIEQLTKEKALELIKLPPLDVTLFDSAETLISKVTDCIEKWDAWLFNRPNIDSSNWSAWVDFCESSENFVMADFVLKAQKQLTKLRS